jgi:hypothetical protein
MLETLGALRSSDMFDIVIDYPDSAPALEDLAACLQHTSLAGHFAASFKAALQQRLLHAGAATGDIIHTYVSTIRAMQQVDKSGECCWGGGSGTSQGHAEDGVLSLGRRHRKSRDGKRWWAVTGVDCHLSGLLSAIAPSSYWPSSPALRSFITSLQCLINVCVHARLGACDFCNEQTPVR